MIRKTLAAATIAAGMLVGPGAAVGGSHRTHTCRRCDAEIYWPPITEQCEHRVFDGR